MKSKPAINVIGTGGTISSMGQDRFDFTRYAEVGRRISIKESLDRIPEVNDLANIVSEDFLSVASSDIGPVEWIQIARRINQVFADEPLCDGIVLTHGTGTMEETAYFLQLSVKSSKPVVMTGAMMPLTAIGTDADRNLYHAIMAASHTDTAGRGVLVCLNNQIHSAREVTKTDPLRVETFQTPGLGALGYADSDGEVVFYRSTVRKHTTSTVFDVGTLECLPRVDIVPIYAGCDDLLMNAVRNNQSQGVVLAGVGGGSGTGAIKESAEKAIKEGLVVVSSSRTATGRAILSPGRQKSGLIVADDLPPLKARILLMLALSVTKDLQVIQEMFYDY